MKKTDKCPKDINVEGLFLEAPWDPVETATSLRSSETPVKIFLNPLRPPFINYGS